MQGSILQSDCEGHSQERDSHGISGVYAEQMPDLPGIEADRTERQEPGESVATAKTVLDAAMERIELMFHDFDHVLVAFSCGKDSGICLSLCYKYAKENNLLHKMAVYYEDYEAGYKTTDEYAQRVFESMTDVRRYWLCLPISAACSVSMYEPRWIPWDNDKKELWVKPMPTLDCVINEDNCPYPFVKGTKGFDARIQFSQWFSSVNEGNTAVVIGIRADESLTRRAIFTSKQRKFMHKSLKYTKTIDEKTCNFYPIFDWKTEDIWVCNARFGFDYNRIYDLYYQAGLSIDQMRVASPFHQSGQDNLKLYRVIDPNNWGKMVGRVNGVNFGGIYGGTTAMGWRTITKPEHFTWKQYAEFLLSTLPEASKKKFEEKIEKSRWHWRVQGGARSPEFIEQLEKEGWQIRRTGKMANRGHRKDELVYIDEMMDDTNVDEFKRAPSWKRVCVAIMKNDTTCMTMGFQRTADQNILRQKAFEKYERRKQSKRIAELEESLGDEDTENLGE